MSQEGTQYTQGSKTGTEASSDWIYNLFMKACRPKTIRQIGLEIERIGIWSDLKPFHYKTDGKYLGACDLLQNLARVHGWKPVLGPGGDIIGLKTETGAVSLEPGSQVEFSVDPYRDLFAALKEIDGFEAKVAKFTSPLGLSWLGIGVNPVQSVDEIDIIPAPRYGFMTDYFRKSGKLGTSMMRLTSSIQLNFDYTSEEEAMEMLRTALLAAPISYLLFSNSPFSAGKVSELLSYRAEIWRQTDPRRTGLVPELFQPGFGFRELAKYFWKQPLMFAQDRASAFIPAHGKSLEDAAKEATPSFPVNEYNQWNAIREWFPEARIKPGYVEVRSIDGVMPKHREASAAFWTGLLYSEDARRVVTGKLGGFSSSDLYAAWGDISKNGFKSNVKGMLDTTLALLEAAKASLKSRGFGEENLLTPAFEIFENRQNPAEALVDAFNSKWDKKIEKVVEAVAF